MGIILIKIKKAQKTLGCNWKEKEDKHNDIWSAREGVWQWGEREPDSGERGVDDGVCVGVAGWSGGRGGDRGWHARVVWLFLYNYIWLCLYGICQKKKFAFVADSTSPRFYFGCPHFFSRVLPRFFRFFLLSSCSCAQYTVFCTFLSTLFYYLIVFSVCYDSIARPVKSMKN